MTKITLTDRFISSPRRVPAAGRQDYPDALVPGLALRVTAAGHRSFVLITRYPLNPKNPTRRTLGDYGELSLDEAREKARSWLALIKRGVDPKIEESRRKAEAQRRQANTFAAVAAEYLERHGKGLKRHAEVRRIIESEFVKRWALRPVTDVMPEECVAAIRAIAKRGRYQAFNSLAYLRHLFGWAIGTHEFGLVASPVANLRPRDLIGKREGRERVLAVDELRAVWEAGGVAGYPFGLLIRLLILTGQRVSEVAEMAWSEVDLDRALWTVPAARMKGNRTHVVPLAPLALSMVQGMPRFAGPFIFTTTAGARPVSGFSKAKARLDRLSGVANWRLHDLRRTMRTHLSALPVQDIVRELVIAHARPGLHKVYDLHAYEVEKRQCLELWEQRLRGIVEPRSLADVTNLEVERVRQAI